MICTLYAHDTRFEDIVQQIKTNFPKGKCEVEEQEGFQIVHLRIKGGLFRSDKKLKISYRERLNFSYKLEGADCPLSNNLSGMLGYVSSLPSENETLKGLLLQKISTLNSEYSISSETGLDAAFVQLIKDLALTADAVIFTQPNTPISKSSVQHFLDKNLNLILDAQGKNGVDTLDVKINSAYYDETPIALSEDQVARKQKNDAFLQKHNIKVNQHLPCIKSESEVQLRNPEEVATRVLILAVTNMVAFNNIEAEQAIGFLKRYELWEVTTPKEKNFLENPTPENKNQETWKCEGIWVLMWALKIVDDLQFPDHLCSLNDIPADQYPIAPGKEPSAFIATANTLRSKAEILNANDLYYRFEWACVEARIHGQAMEAVHPSVVYERHYALNWLINYQGQDWDNVTCDT